MVDSPLFVIELSPPLARQIIRDAMGMAMKALVFATPGSAMPRFDWFDQLDGQHHFELEACRSDRALAVGDELARLHPLLQAGRSWRAFRVLQKRLDAEFPIGKPAAAPASAPAAASMTPEQRAAAARLLNEAQDRGKSPEK